MSHWPGTSRRTGGGCPGRKPLMTAWEIILLLWGDCGRNWCFLYNGGPSWCQALASFGGLWCLLVSSRSPLIFAWSGFTTQLSHCNNTMHTGVVTLRDFINNIGKRTQKTQTMGNSFSNPIRGSSSSPAALSLTQFLQKFLICLGSGYHEIGPFQPMHVDLGLLNCPTSPSHEKQTKSDQAKISLCQSSDWFLCL